MSTTNARASGKVRNGAQIIDGTTLGNQLLDTTAHQVELLRSGHNVIPGLAVIIVGDDPASHVYVKRKGIAAEKVGIQSILYRLSASTSQNQLIDIITSLNAASHIHGILIQLPLPAHISKNAVINAIAPEKDVDGFHVTNAGKLTNTGGGIVPCTPLGCLMLIKKTLGENLTGKKAVVIGTSTIVGKPLSTLLLHENCTVTMCHVHTRDIEQECATADIVVVATGVPSLVKKSWIKPGACVIDVGINRVDGKLVGDVDYAEVVNVAGSITPVPGGVGPMTVACLMHNTVVAAVNQNKIVLNHDSGVYR